MLGQHVEAMTLDLDLQLGNGSSYRELEQVAEGRLSL